MKDKPLPSWCAPLITVAGVPFTFIGIFYSRIGAHLAHGQREILEEKSFKATALVWLTILAGVIFVRFIRKKFSNKNPA